MTRTTQGMKVLVTGAGGFIGSHLVEELVLSGARVRALVKYSSGSSWGNLAFLPKHILNEVEVTAGDIQDPFICDDITRGIECVFHLAALIGIPYSYAAPMSYVDVNIKGTMNMLQAARKHGVSRFIHTSTSETYGTARYTPIDEKHPLQGQSPYSASKIAADKIAESFWLSFELPVVTVRPFNTYGPRQSARAIIPTIISQLSAGHRKIRLGSLSPVRDLNYVKDTVAGFLAAATSSDCAGEVFNLGTGSGISIGDLASLIMRLMGAGAEILTEERRVRPENSEVRNLICNSGNAANKLGWGPMTPLEEGLIKTIDFVLSNPSHYRPDQYTI